MVNEELNAKKDTVVMTPKEKPKLTLKRYRHSEFKWIELRVDTQTCLER